jgi:hypothetical protein
MATWKCTYVNPAKKTACTGTMNSDNKPKGKCPLCGRVKWEEDTTGTPVVVVAGPTAWPVPLPPRLLAALNGTYVTGENNTQGDAAVGTCNTTYGGGKHWGGEWDAGQYDLTDVNANVVLGLEMKAVRIGLGTAGGWVFKFSFSVGHTCKKGNNKGLPYDPTTCIRVDSGGTGQHSHPIPEWGALTTSSHEKEVKMVIIAAVNSFDVDRLAEVGEYLKLIGATNKSYAFSNKDAQKLINPLPASIYW